ncbi:MAG: ATP-binding protein [Ignavibacteriaceae bacterium]
MFNYNDDEVSLEELDLLIQNQTSEKRTIDYKLNLILDTDENKKEFLADIISFANTSGGIIIYGMREEKGIPIELIGITIENADLLKGRIESIIRDGISPKYSSANVVVISINDTHKAIIIKIPKSWSAPHLIWYKRSSKFFARNSSHGKYQLEISEIRASILASEYLYEKIRNFRLDRISKIINHDTPVELLNEPQFVLHIIPMNSFSIQEKIDSNKFTALINTPNSLHDYRKEFNFDGFVFHNRFDQIHSADRYFQIFRNGIIELVNANFTDIEDNCKLISGKKFERFYIEEMSTWIDLLKFFGFTPPFVLLFSVLGIRGYKFRLNDNRFYQIANKPITTDNLLVHDILAESNFMDEHDKSLKIIFDPIWNACGFPGSLNYDAAVRWVDN